MKSKRLDDMPMDDVISRINKSYGEEKNYWMKVARVKLREHRSSFPMFRKFGITGFEKINADYTAKVDELQKIYKLT